jgi:hypothetical protein
MARLSPISACHDFPLVNGQPACTKPFKKTRKCVGVASRFALDLGCQHQALITWRLCGFFEGCSAKPQGIDFNEKYGAGYKIRTRDPLITNQVLYQLS